MDNFKIIDETNNLVNKDDVKNSYLDDIENTIVSDDTEKMHMQDDYYIISLLKEAKSDSEKSYLISRLHSKELVTLYFQEINDIWQKVNLARDGIILDEEIVKFINDGSKLTSEQILLCMCGIRNHSYDETKITFLKNHQFTNLLKVQLLKTLSDENKLLYYKFFLTEDSDIALIFMNSSDQTKLSFIKQSSNNLLNFSIACTMLKDNYKIEAIPYLNRDTAIDLICSLKVYSKKIVLSKYKLHDNEKMKIIYTFAREEQQELCDKYGLILLPEDILSIIDEKLTIGIELEVEGPSSSEIHEMEDNQLFGWHSKGDGSLQNGVEVVSPILTYSNKCIKSIYDVCELLKNKNQYVTERCGGHIHFGYNYFSDEKMLLAFYILFSYFEKEIYAISNSAGSTIRRGVSQYASPISPIVKNINDEIKNGRFALSSSMPDIFKRNQATRYMGLNLMNIGNGKNTIEFRLPNSNINPDEILHNIILFGRLIMKSKELAENDNKFLEFISVTMSNNNDKIDTLLNMLFNDEQHKSFYQQRYEANKDGLLGLNFSTISLDDYSFLLLKYYTFTQIFEAKKKQIVQEQSMESIGSTRK